MSVKITSVAASARDVAPLAAKENKFSKMKLI